MRRTVGVLVGAGVAIALGVRIYQADKPAPRADAPTASSAEADPGGQHERSSPDAPLAQPTTRPHTPRERSNGALSPRAVVNAGKEASSDTLVAVRRAIAEKTDATTQTLMRALGSDDSVAKLEAIDELARRRHVAAIQPLLKVDPADDPFVGPTALLALGRLAHEAGGGPGEAAVARLSKLLEAEKARQGSDSPGNILLIFEALGHTKIPSGARVLERELVAPEHGTAAKVAIVDALEACGQRSSAGDLAAYRETFQISAADAFERELEKDLAAALDRALAALSQ